jgi:uncharacterized cofD-like protein
VQGRVLPSTLTDVKLVADKSLPYVRSEVRVEGESMIPQTAGMVRRVWLDPNSPPAYPEVIKAVLSADLIVIGPGSLYTSILPNLMVPDLAEAVRASRALKLYVCNIATQQGETDGFSCEDHIQAMEDNAGGGLFDLTISNSNFDGDLPDEIDWVYSETDGDYAVYMADVIDEAKPYRHDPEKLAKIIIDIYQERTGPLIE